MLIKYNYRAVVGVFEYLPIQCVCVYVCVTPPPPPSANKNNNNKNNNKKNNQKQPQITTSCALPIFI